MARIPAFLRGHKGGSKFKNTPDTIRSEDTVEVILGVGEGDNFGLSEGAKSFFLGGTRLVNTNGEANFKDFQLTEYTGQTNAPPIFPALGGFGSPTAANAASLARNTPVVRTGQLTQIDYIDLRFLVQQLHTSNDKGIYASDLNIKVEYRPSLPAGQPWKLAWSYANPIPPGYEEDRGDGVNQFTGGERPQDAYNSLHTFDGDNLLLRNEAVPTEPVGVFTNIWVDPSTGATAGRPNVWNEATQTWDAAPGVTSHPEFWEYEGTRFYKNPVNPPPSPKVGDVWTPPGGGPPVRYNGTSWVAALRSSAEIQRYQAQQKWAQWLGLDVSQPGLGNANGVLSMKQKITSPVVREIRVPVEPIDVPYEIRVTKISADTSSDGKSVSEVGWESFEEIVAKAMSFPDTHIIHLIGRASDQFNSLPELTGDIKGRIIDVPTNYDPVTRTYSGVWDGLFKRAWSNNGAWCTRDFIKNNRYGLSALYPHEVNEASFYNWAQWCDQAIPDNKGGSRPRWTYNDVLDQPRSAKEQVDYMAGSCGARLIDDGSGTFDVLIDKDAPISMIFGPENVLDGEFTYSFSDIQTRANWIKVGFVNPELNWEVDWRVVQDPNHIAEFGRIPLEFVATGKTNVSEALAAARLRLAVTTGEYTGVTFRTNRQGKYLVPFMNVGISDPDMGWGLSGRISERVSARQVRLRDPVYLETGVVYRFIFNRPTVPITTVAMMVAPGQAGSLTTINFTEDLPADLPEFAQFSVESYNAATMEPIGLPKAFRILTITPSDENDVVEITALELNRSKWAYSDGTGELLPPEEYSNFNGELTRPQNVKVSTYTANVGGLVRRSLAVTWDQPTNPFGRNTWIEYSRDGADFVKVGESDTEYFELEDAPNGIHALRLTHVHVDGKRRSLPVTVVHEIGTFRTVPSPQNLRMVDQPTAPAFDTDEVTFEWDVGEEDPNFSFYRVKVLHNVNWAQPGGPESWVMLRVVEVGSDLRWTYNLDDITQDGHRNFRVQVHQVDDFGNESLPSNPIDAINPVPSAPIVTVAGTIGGVNIILTPPVERDVVGALVHVSTDTVPMERVLEGNQQQFYLELPDGDTRTIIAAYYDRHGKLDLNWSIPVQAAWVLLPPDAVEGVGEIIERLETVENLTDDIAQSVVDLENMYGDTASAAASAAAAAISAADAAAEAATAQGKAEDAMAAAVGASASADDAALAASASAASASAASASATDAEQAASASQADRLLAQTARGEAQTAATQAASSKDDAAGSAASASASAALAANSRDDAAGSASAAAGSASTATTKAGEAGVSAAAAAASQVSASTAAKGASDQAAGLLYSAFDSRDTWTQQTSPGGPTSALPSVTSYQIVTDPDLGQCLEVISAAEATISHKGAVFGVGRTHKLGLKAKCVAPGATTPFFRDARLTDALGYITRGAMPQAQATAGQIVDYTQDVPTGDRLAGTANATHVRFGFSCSGTWRLSMFSVEDTTESAAAGTAASAAATSASSASASETAAGQSATAASGSATNAATSAGQALTYSNQASSSAADANAASVSAGVAASTARMTAIMSLPERVSEFENFAGAADGRPETIGPFAWGTPSTDPVEGDVLRIVGPFNIVNRGWLKLAPGRTYRVTVRAGVVVDGVGNQIQVGFRMLRADGSNVTVTGINRNMALADGFIEHSFERTSEQLWASWSSAVYIRAHARPNRNSSNTTSGATTDMAFLRLEDVTESASAANSAAAAVTQAANASASAASAQISADLAASVGMESNPNLLPNSTFADGMTGWVAGTGWVTTSNRFGPYALTSTNGTSQVRMTPRIAAGAGQIYTLSGDFLRTATSGAVMADIEWFNSSGGLISRSPAISVTTNRAFGAGRLSTTGAAPTGTASLQVRFYGSAWAGTALGVRQLKLEFGDKATTWRDDAQMIGLTAQLNITAATVADLDTRMASARFEVTAAAGGNLAQLKIRADTSGSLAALVAQAVSFSNTVNGAVVEVMKITGGRVFITGVLTIGTVGAGRIEIDGPNMRIDVYDDQNRLRGRFGKLS